jgi:cytochrome b561
MSEPRTATPARYDRVAMSLHWLVGAALVAQIIFGYLLDDIAPRGTPDRGAVINLHKSIGIVLALLAAARIAWRLRHPAPAWPASLSPRQRLAADWSHHALYACMVVVPLAGYVASNFSKHGVRFFGVMLPPWGPDLPAVYAALGNVHVATAALFAILVALHVAAALKHRFFDRDDVFDRMWPGHAPAIDRADAPTR